MGTLTLPAKGADFQPPPAGAHIAVCYRVIDLGTQEGSYKGKANKKHLILISWELPDELMQDGRPFTISKRYTLSSNKKSRLRGDLESWRGRAFDDSEFGTFDIGKLIGAGCMLNVVHEDKDDSTYANVATIMRLPKGTKAPAPKNETLCFSLEAFDERDFDKLSDRIRETIMKSPEYKKAVGEWVGDEPPTSNGHDYGNDLNDEIPF
jgi:hypothetical protein